MNERRRRRAPRLVSILGSIGGGLVAVVLEGLVWLLAEPGRDAELATRHVQRALERGSLPEWGVFALGAAVGLIVVGIASGSNGWRRVTDQLFTLVLLAAGSITGAALGLLAYMVLWLGAHPDQAVETLITDMPVTLLSGPNPALYLALGGAFIGFAVMIYSVGNQALGDLARTVLGTFLGAVMGVVMYSVAYIAVTYPRVPDSPYYFLHMGEALYSGSPIEFFFAGFGALIGLLLARYSWRFYGVVTLASLIAVVLGFLSYSFFVTLPKVEDPYRPFAIVLFVCEAASLAMVVLYSFYTIDVATRKRWKKIPRDAPYSAYYVPKVCFQVPCFNEPPELVLATLQKLLDVDYPADRLLIMVLDDSTRPESAHPLEAFCQKNGIAYHHRDDRRGYKAGALNDSLPFVPDDVELLAIIDADYQVSREYLKECIGYFIDPNVAWIQTPQDYRNRYQSFLAEQYYLADAYFYRTVMPSRNEENTIIFCGTMGILRKSALAEVGGWGEKYISEDAELSVRLLSAGFDSLYINKTYGRGLIPATFEAYRKQHYRWAFGGAKILRGHFKDIAFGRLSLRQSFDFFVGSIHWFEGIFIFLIAAILVFLGLGEIFQFRVVTHHSQEILLIGLVPFFLLTDGLTRLHMVLRESMKLSLGQTIRVLGMWMSVKFSNAFGAVKSFVGFNMPFVRTPKAPLDRIGRLQAVGRAVRVAKFESAMAAVLFSVAAGLAYRLWVLSSAPGGVALTRLFLFFWVLYYCLIFLAAPLYAYKSYVTFRPDAGTARILAARGRHILQ